LDRRGFDESGNSRNLANHFNARVQPVDSKGNDSRQGGHRNFGQIARAQVQLSGNALDILPIAFEINAWLVNGCSGLSAGAVDKYRSAQ
jgi:hypothetical protein